VAFNELPSPRFAEAELAGLVTRQVRLAGWELPAPASITKDVDCLTKMYAPRKTPKEGSPGNFEDLLDCPFRELGLLEATPGKGHLWRFTSLSSTSLPSRLVAYACLDYASRHTSAAGSVTLARLASEPGSPGRAFKLREPDIAAALEEVSEFHPAITVTDTVGHRSLVNSGNPHDLAWEILDAHFGNARDRIPSRQDWQSVHPELAAELRRREQHGIQLQSRAGEVA
jgi:hypothetical protein